MKTISKYILALGSIFFLSSCSIQKRLYRPGFTISKNKVHKASNRLDVPKEIRDCGPTITIAHEENPETQEASIKKSGQSSFVLKKSQKKNGKSNLHGTGNPNRTNKLSFSRESTNQVFTLSGFTKGNRRGKHDEPEPTTKSPVLSVLNYLFAIAFGLAVGFGVTSSAEVLLVLFAGLFFALFLIAGNFWRRNDTHLEAAQDPGKSGDEKRKLYYQLSKKVGKHLLLWSIPFLPSLFVGIPMLIIGLRWAIRKPSKSLVKEKHEAWSAVLTYKIINIIQLVLMLLGALLIAALMAAL